MILSTEEAFRSLLQKRFKIGLDARSLANTEKSGVEGYVASLVADLPKFGPDINWYFFVDKRYRSVGPPPANVKYIRIPFINEPRFWLLVSLYARTVKLDLFHFPIALVPKNFSIPAVITIYDLASEVYPEFYTAKELEIHRRQVRDSVNQKAAGILAISESTKQDLIKFYDADPQKIHVSYLSPHIAGGGVKKDSPFEFDYMLCVGNIQPRKNFPRAVEALSKQANSNLHLVIAGKAESQSELQRIHQAAAEAGIEDRVHITGYMSRVALNNCFAHAKLLLYPSFYEGFGIPLLEAFYFGVPVVTSESSSMPEIAQAAAKYCNPNSVTSIAQAIDAALSPEVSKNLVAKGHQRLEQLSKTPLASSTLDAYQKIINSLNSN